MVVSEKSVNFTYGKGTQTKPHPNNKMKANTTTTSYNEYKVLKVSAGYTIKTLPTYEAAKAYAEKCCKANNNRDFTVCAWNGGMLIEL